MPARARRMESPIGSSSVSSHARAVEDFRLGAPREGPNKFDQDESVTASLPERPCSPSA